MEADSLVKALNIKSRAKASRNDKKSKKKSSEEEQDTGLGSVEVNDEVLQIDG